jgi:hypothetical protein
MRKASLFDPRMERADTGATRSLLRWGDNEMQNCRAAILLLVTFGNAMGARIGSAPESANLPYPPSHVLEGITWRWESMRTAAPGSDCWPVTWADDGDLYAAWGDGGGFDGTDSDGRVALGFARIQGVPESYRAVNVNGGKDPEHPSSFPRAGKTGGILAVDSSLYRLGCGGNSSNVL